MLCALAMVKSPAKEALEAGSVSAQKINEAINDLRKGRNGDTGGRRGHLRGAGKIYP
jgi:ATP-dependent Clp protease ATP-binding subunit ClpB